MRVGKRKKKVNSSAMQCDHNKYQILFYLLKLILLTSMKNIYVDSFFFHRIS